jgi:hypothetical protein
MRWPDAGLRATAAEVRAEWRAEEAEWTRAALERFEHARTLVDVLRAAMHRGDEVLLGPPSEALRGVVVHVGDDWCRLQTAAGACDVPLAPQTPVVRVVERARQGGVTGSRSAPATWRARLLEHEAAGRPCAVGVGGGEVVVGSLRVGADHVVVRGQPELGRDAYVPLGAVCWVRV